MKPIKRNKSGYKKIFFEDGICVYCGVPQEVGDHSLPYSAKDAFNPTCRWLVPACRECNALAGASVQHYLSERIVFVKERLQKRYARLLRTPSWSVDELAEMSPEFRDRILLIHHSKQFIRDRLAFDYFTWVELGKPRELRIG